MSSMRYLSENDSSWSMMGVQQWPGCKTVLDGWILHAGVFDGHGSLDRRLDR